MNPQINRQPSTIKLPKEIEAKLKVDALDGVGRRLQEYGATFVRETLQTDTYFDTAGRDLTRSDKCLRLRRETRGMGFQPMNHRQDADATKTHGQDTGEVGPKEHLILAYKGPKEADDYKRRAEVELEVSDAVAAESLLAALGYEKALAFDKRRCLWRLRGCEVALDTLPLLGVFVEVEGPDSSTIARVQEMLGLAHAPHIMDSYACLIERELARLGQGRREVYLEDGKCNG